MTDEAISNGADQKNGKPDDGTPQNQSDMQRLLDFVNTSGKVNIGLASDELNLNRMVVSKLADDLSRQHLIKIESHYLREPDLESIDYKQIKDEMSLKTHKLLLETPSVPMKRSGKLPDVSEKVIEEYLLESDDTHYRVQMIDADDYVLHYKVSIPHIDFVTRALLDETKKTLIGELRIEVKDVYEADKFQKLKVKFEARSKEKLKNVLKKSSDEYISTLSKLLVNEMIGLGDIEYLLLDNMLEEIVVNSSKSVVWVYHKKYKWMKTNIILPTEDLIINYSSRIAREVGREITHLKPLLDAHLSTGDRVNATLSPISTQGNTITIRRFSRTPWSAVYMLSPEFKTINSEAAAFLWLAIEFELSLMVSGGTAAGKTSLLNALMPFMPANQRIISIEDTRELNLPEYLHWVPMTTREPNPEGDGGIMMLDLLQNSLRMRPDRMIVGEVRAKREAEVLFEAMHTGHSVYSTFHAERAQEVVDRITTPPMSIPPTVLKSLHLIAVQYRNRRTGQRRVFEICEILKDESETPKLNTLYKWDPRTDTINKVYPSLRIKEELSMFTGMNEKEIEVDLAGKKKILDWLLQTDVKGVNEVGLVVTEYYRDKNHILEVAESGKKIDFID
ncbi:MAG: type II/IV secretion system ATPase subunit [Candidatus Altiarchaeota archaeon]|nr:type II/IV secretion system ATPase subunit [Candidatus Altiarchaeota archaeon]